MQSSIKKFFYFIFFFLFILLNITPLEASEYYQFVLRWPSQFWYFSYVQGIATDSSENVFVVDRDGSTIIRFDSDGNFITSWGSYGTSDGQFKLPSAAAVDSSGYVYIADTGNNRIQKFDSNGNFIKKWGTAGTGDGQFNNPQGVAVDTSGYVYVADTDNNRIQQFTSSGTFLGKTGTSGSGDGQFNKPQAIAVDSSGNSYIADTGNNRIQKLDSVGNYASQWGTSGTGDSQFDSPQSISVDSSNNVYVADTDNSRIQKFDSSGVFISKFGTNGSGDGEFINTNAVAVAGTGNIYVASGGSTSAFTWSHKIQKFDSNGILTAKWAATGEDDGQFQEPKGITTDGNGNIYVADTRNNRVEKFTSAGVFDSKFGSSGSGDGEFTQPQGIAVDSSGNIYVADTNNHRIEKFDSAGTFLIKFGTYGSENGQLSYPGALAADSSGNIYVADTYNHRVQKFDSSGTYLSKIGSAGTGNSQFSYPQGIAIDSSGNIYVADTGNNRIEKFNSSGTYLGKWGSNGTSTGKFSSPIGLSVDASGYIYVADTSNHRIQKFDKNGNSISTATVGSYGFGDGELYYPYGVTVDSAKNTYVADTYNHRIQKFERVPYGLLVADLITEIDASASSVMIDDVLTYTVSVANIGPDPATEVSFTDNLPVTITLGTVSSDKGTCSADGVNVTCDLATLESGEEAAITITISTTEKGKLLNTVTAFSAESDPDISNNTATVQTTVDPDPVTLTISTEGAGSGTVTSSDSVITCGETCSHVYTQTVVITLTATPEADSKFAGWSGDVTGEDEIISVTMDSDTTCTATFIEKDTIGVITVTTNIITSTFSITGPADYEGSGELWSQQDAPSGNYTITYGQVEGYKKPPSEGKTLEPEGNITFSGSYVKLDSSAPDIRVKNIRYPLALKKGKTFKLSTQGKNIGGQDASAFTVRLYYSSNNSGSFDGDILIKEKVLSGLATDTQKTVTYNWKVPKSLAKGKYYLKVFWDADNSVNEYNEGNNIAVTSKRVTVK
ncbi:MAG: SMP-30/gluconolactonase/LRE family protein [Candidatus Schekmanbacteria bacterium]|nr:SMP-30/gluconolactonase/LRE family protein [Candidatus Schekmanbacteria bacterium]